MSKRVLVVDDHAPTRALIRTILEAGRQAAFEVTAVATGAESLRAFEQKPFDLVLLDVHLPDSDGYTVCRQMRARDPQIPIVFVTAQGGVRDYTAGRDAGGDSYLVKPVSRAALRSLAILFTSVERTRPRSEASASPAPAAPAAATQSDTEKP